MNLMMFPRMFASHDEGWAWLMRVHPSVPRMYFLYALPMSLIPPAMLLYATSSYGEHILAGSLSMREAWMLAVLFFIAEAVMVPVMGAVIQRIGAIAEARPSYHDAFAFAAVVPTPLWLCAIVLFVPSLTINALAVAIAVYLTGMLIYEGSYRIFQVDNEGKSLLLAGSVLAAGLVAWIALMLMGFVAWGFAIA